jgi:geranylgeranyl diphosphate synthase type I
MRRIVTTQTPTPKVRGVDERVEPLGPPPALATAGTGANARLAAFLSSEIDRWSGPMPDVADAVRSLQHLIGAGGKRLRPAFCFWAYVGAGGTPDDPIIADTGAALELLHTMALVHDDVMDGSDRRRGVPTVHRTFIERHATGGWQGDGRRFGEGAAILVGDFAFVYSDMLMAGAEPRARAVFDELRVELCVGQFLDLVGTASRQRDAGLAQTIERYKSGKYTVERPLHLGAALAERLDELEQPLSAVGIPLGEAFQMRDDLLGIFGDESVTGKPVGDDLRQGKLTPLIAAADARIDGKPDRALFERIGADDLSQQELVALRELLVACGAVDEVEDQIRSRVTQCLGALDAAALTSEAREALGALARYAAWRDR